VVEVDGRRRLCLLLLLLLLLWLLLLRLLLLLLLMRLAESCLVSGPRRASRPPGNTGGVQVGQV
jgi:hypothetical protein